MVVRPLESFFCSCMLFVQTNSIELQLRRSFSTSLAIILTMFFPALFINHGFDSTIWSENELHWIKKREMPPRKFKVKYRCLSSWPLFFGIVNKLCSLNTFLKYQKGKTNDNGLSSPNSEFYFHYTISQDYYAALLTKECQAVVKKRRKQTGLFARQCARQHCASCRAYPR